MAAIDELRTEVENSELIGIVVNDIASALVDVIKNTPSKSLSSGKNPSMTHVPATQYSGILFKLGLLDTMGVGEHITLYRVTDKGVEYGKRILQERQSAETQEVPYK